MISESLEDFNFSRANIRLDHSTPEEMEALRYETTLEVNFVDNYDLNHGAPKQALIGFKDAAERIPAHAFAHYFSAKAYEQLEIKKRWIFLWQNIMTVLKNRNNGLVMLKNLAYL